METPGYSVISTRSGREALSIIRAEGSKVAAIALANKIARMAWAMMAKGERYKEPASLAA